MMCDGLVFVWTCSSGVCPRSLLRRWLNWAVAAQSGATGEQRTGTGDLRHSLIRNWHAGVVPFKPNWSKRHLASLISIPISPSEEWLNIKDGRRTRVLILALPFFPFFLHRVCWRKALMSESKIVYCRLILEAEDKQIYRYFYPTFFSLLPGFSTHNRLSETGLRKSSDETHVSRTRFASWDT